MHDSMKRRCGIVDEGEREGEGDESVCGKKKKEG